MNERTKNHIPYLIIKIIIVIKSQCELSKQSAKANEKKNVYHTASEAYVTVKPTHIVSFDATLEFKSTIFGLIRYNYEIYFDRTQSYLSR